MLYSVTVYVRVRSRLVRPPRVKRAHAHARAHTDEADLWRNQPVDTDTAQESSMVAVWNTANAGAHSHAAYPLERRAHRLLSPPVACGNL